VGLASWDHNVREYFSDSDIIWELRFIICRFHSEIYVQNLSLTPKTKSKHNEIVSNFFIQNEFIFNVPIKKYLSEWKLKHHYFKFKEFITDPTKCYVKSKAFKRHSFRRVKVRRSNHNDPPRTSQGLSYQNKCLWNLVIIKVSHTHLISVTLTFSQQLLTRRVNAVVDLIKLFWCKLFFVR
jgi:hypothetical protein